MPTPLRIEVSFGEVQKSADSLQEVLSSYPQQSAKLTTLQTTLNQQFEDLKTTYERLNSEVTRLEKSKFNIPRRRMIAAAFTAMAVAGWCCNFFAVIWNRLRQDDATFNFTLSSKILLIAFTALTERAWDNVLTAERKQIAIRASHRNAIQDAEKLKDFIDALQTYNPKATPRTATKQIQTCASQIKELKRSQSFKKILPSSGKLVSILILSLPQEHELRVRFNTIFENHSPSGTPVLPAKALSRDSSELQEPPEEKEKSILLQREVSVSSGEKARFRRTPPKNNQRFLSQSAAWLNFEELLGTPINTLTKGDLILKRINEVR